MNFDAYGLCDPGLRRPHNEDHFMVDEQNKLCMVADGMGWRGTGTPASQLVIKDVHSFMRRHREVLDRYASEPTIRHRDQLEMMVSEAIRTASEKLYNFSTEDKKIHGSGTTLTVFGVCGNKGFVAHVGDSRVYLLRDDEVHQLTDDHTLLYEYLKQGLITPEELRKSQQRKIITRAVGLTEATQVDFQHMELAGDDRFLLCTDGFHFHLNDTAELNQIFKVHELTETPAALIKMANSRGGIDNIGVVAVEIQNEEEEERSQDFTSETTDIKLQLDLLWVVPFFAELDYAELLALHSLFTPSKVQIGEVIIEEDTEGDEFYVLLAGEMAVTRHGTELDRLRRGAHFGEMSLVDRGVRSASVVATLPSLLMSVDRASLFALMRKERALAVKILWSFTQTLTKRLRKADEEISTLKSEDSQVFGRFSMPPPAEDKPYSSY